MSDSYYTFVSDHIRDKLVTVFPTMNISELIAYGNDDKSATVSKLTAQGSHDRQTTDLPVLAALVLSGL